MDLKFLDSKGHNLQEITQWDINRKVEITGIQPHELIEVHFYNAVSTRALVVDPVVELEKIIVDIPNILVQQATDLFMAVFVKDGKEGKTEQIYSIPVRKKKKPESYTYEENIDYVSWVELSEKAKKQLAEMQSIIDDVNNKLQSGEFEGNGIKSITKIRTEGLTDTYRIEFTKGQPFEYNVTNGYTPVKGKDYFTEQEKAEMVEETKTKVVTIVEKDSANSIDLNIDSNYLMTANLKNKKGETISTATIDFPIESMVVNASYSNGKLTLTLQNGNNLEVDISAIVSGLVNETTFNAKVKELNQQIANANQEIDQLTGEVSDIKLQQGTFKQEQTLQNANIGKNTNDIHTLINAISTISPAYDKETAKAEEITITDGTENPAKIEIYGNTKQETTKGYQLLNINNGNYNLDSGIINVKNGTFELKNLKTDDGLLIPVDFILQAGDYYVSLNKEINVTLTFKDSNKNNIFNSRNEKVTLNKEENIKYIYVYIGANIDNDYFKPLIYLYSNKSKPYEPYTGGQPSPNPDYPQEIESVKGYNLFDCVNQPFNNTSGSTELSRIPNGIRATQTKAGSGSFYADMVLDSNKFKKGKTYTLSFIGKASSQNRANVLLEYSNEKGLDSVAIGSSLKEPITFEYNPPLGKPYILFTLYSTAGGIVNIGDYADYTDIQLIEGTEQKPYSPYGEIAVKQTGKNLFDIKSTPISLNTFYDNNGNFVNWAQTTGIKDYLLVEPNKDYIFSNYKGTGIIVVLYNQNKEIIKSIKTAKFQTTNDTKYIRFGIGNSTEISNELQLEEGTKVTEYEPYKETIYPLHLGDIELNKIGDSQDYFHKVGSNWYLHKEIEKVNKFTSSMMGNPSALGTTVQNQILLDKPTTKEKRQYVKFSHFQNLINNDYNIEHAFIGEGGIPRVYRGLNLFLSNKNNITTPKDWLDWLINNSFYLVYPLEIPTETLIEEPTLISQLNALEKAQTFKGTNILTNNSIAEMKLNYKADTKIYLDNLFPAPEKQAEITQ